MNEPHDQSKRMPDVNPMTHTEPVAYPPGRDPVLDVPHDRDAAVHDFSRVLFYSLLLAAVFVIGAHIITS